MIEIIRERIPDGSLDGYLNRPFPDMIKFVVDLKRAIIALGGELHADAEEILLQDGSGQADLWGGNIYPSASAEERIKYTSLINIRPSQDNNELEVMDVSVRSAIRLIVDKLVL